MKRIDILKTLLRRYQEPIAYLLFGGCSMLANVMAYYLCFRVFHYGNIPSAVIAWIVAVLIAFITNKLWVFGSKSSSQNVFAKELLSFFSCRVATGLIDLAIMYVAVDCLSQNEMLWKLVSNVIVIVLNYIASKLLIFKNRSSK